MRIDASPRRLLGVNESDRSRYRRGLLHLQVAFISAALCECFARVGADSLLSTSKRDWWPRRARVHRPVRHLYEPRGIRCSRILAHNKHSGPDGDWIPAAIGKHSLLASDF